LHSTTAIVTITTSITNATTAAVVARSIVWHHWNMFRINACDASGDETNELGSNEVPIGETASQRALQHIRLRSFFVCLLLISRGWGGRRSRNNIERRRAAVPILIVLEKKR
jgi:hypothetical protein